MCVVSDADTPRPWLRIHSALVTTEEPPLTDTLWRAIPYADFARNLEVISGVKLPDMELTLAELARPVEIEGHSPGALKRYFDETEPLPASFATSGLSTSDGRPVIDFPLIPDGGGRSRLTDEFLQAVASAYLLAVESNAAPAPAIAVLADAPVRTVHRWVAEARRRGFLPPATKGKAG